MNYIEGSLEDIDGGQVVMRHASSHNRTWIGRFHEKQIRLVHFVQVYLPVLDLHSPVAQHVDFQVRRLRVQQVTA